MKTIILFLALATALFGQAPGALNNYLISSVSLASKQGYEMAFRCGLIINTETGEVTIPKGMEITDAAKAFWREVEAAYPYAFPKDRHNKSDVAQPMTTAWDSYFTVGSSPFITNQSPIARGGVKYEFGLRSDGAVVWREVK